MPTPQQYQLDDRERRVIRYLARHEPALGIKGLAEGIRGYRLSFERDSSALKRYLRAVRHLVDRRLVRIERSGTTVLLTLTSDGRTLAAILTHSPSPRRRGGVLLGTASLGAAIAGCAIATKPEAPSPAYQPEHWTPVRVVQVHTAGPATTEWTYCSDNCPLPTPKTLPPPEQPKPTAVAPASPPVQTETLSLSADVLFDFDSAALTALGSTVLDGLGAKLKARAGLSITVIGYTDRLGSDAYNLRLSRRRAEAVKAHLRAFIAPDEIDATGRGKADPVTGNTCVKTHERKALLICLQPDRRVEIKVSPSPRNS